MSRTRCDKVAFWSIASVKKAMRYLRQRGMRRYYHCDCGAYHVTSDPR